MLSFVGNECSSKYIAARWLLGYFEWRRVFLVFYPAGCLVLTTTGWLAGCFVVCSMFYMPPSCLPVLFLLSPGSCAV